MPSNFFFDFKERSVHDFDVEDLKKSSAFYNENCCKNRCNKIIPKQIAVKHRYDGLLMGSSLYVDKIIFLLSSASIRLGGELIRNYVIYRYDFIELEKNEQDLIILGHLQMHQRIKELETEYGKQMKRGSSRFSDPGHLLRKDMQYFFADFPICRRMYFFLNNLGEKRYKNLKQHFDQQGIAPRIHKLTQKSATRSSVMSVADTENIVNFIKNFAERVAVSLPGRLPQFRDYKIMKLPSSETKRSVYRRYKETASRDDQLRDVEESTFCKIWRKYCPYIATMKPADDLCDLCRQNGLVISQSANLDDKIKEKNLSDAIRHLNQAKGQREFYNCWREKSKSADPAKLLVLSFDFAENVAYPRSPQQVSSAYFKTARKCGIFGIQNEATHVQYNYLIDEEDSVGKGANVVISMLDSFFNSNIAAENVVLFADNCVGQNKNNAVIQYCLWRVLTGKNKTISFNFLLTGHTKFGPDRNFGILKAKYARSDVDSLEDFIDVVNTSSPNGFNKALPSIDPISKVRNVVWCQWDMFLQQFFKPLVGITQYHHFLFNTDGKITAKLFADSPEETIHLQTATLETAEAYLVEEIIPKGFTTERAWYLYNEIRKLCVKETAKDLVAPKPKSSKPKGRKRKVTSSTI